MTPSFTHAVNFVDSAAIKELKIIPNDSLYYPSNLGTQIVEIILKIEPSQRPLSIVTKPKRRTIWLHYQNKQNIETIVNVLYNHLSRFNTQIIKGKNSGGSFIKIRVFNAADYIDLEIKFPGVGEKRIFLGSYTSTFGNYFTTQLEIYKHNGICILKSDLETYLRDSQTEYLFPTQKYYLNEIRNVYKKNIILLKTLPSKIVGQFDVKYDDQSRIFIKDKNSRQGVLKLINQFCIPLMTRIEFVFDEINQMIYVRPRFYNSEERIFNNSDYLMSAVYQQRNILSEIDPNYVDYISNNSLKNTCQRDPIRQNQFRNELIHEQGECVLTSVRVDSAIEAAHIKPFSYCCQEGEIDKLYDPNNGFLLRRDLHSIFDSGLISFYISGELAYLKISSSIAVRDRAKLGIVEGQELRCSISKRKEFLKWHETYIFKS
jgi:hypothetical protein